MYLLVYTRRYYRTTIFTKVFLFFYIIITHNKIDYNTPLELLARPRERAGGSRTPDDALRSTTATRARQPAGFRRPVQQPLDPEEPGGPVLPAERRAGACTARTARRYETTKRGSGTRHRDRRRARQERQVRSRDHRGRSRRLRRHGPLLYLFDAQQNQRGDLPGRFR